MRSTTSTAPATGSARSARTPNSHTALTPITDHANGIDDSRIEDGETPMRNPMVRMVVGHGTPNVGIRGYAKPSAHAIPGYARL